MWLVWKCFLSMGHLSIQVSMAVCHEIASEMGKSQPPQPPLSAESKRGKDKGKGKKVKDVSPLARNCNSVFYWFPQFSVECVTYSTGTLSTLFSVWSKETMVLAAVLNFHNKLNITFKFKLSQKVWYFHMVPDITWHHSTKIYMSFK